MIKTPLKVIKRNNKTVALYLFLMFLSYATTYLYLLSDIHISDAISVTIHCLFGLSTLFFLFSWLRDPGYLIKDTRIDFFQIIEKFDVN
jgi:hypothetical protein